MEDGDGDKEEGEDEGEEAEDEGSGGVRVAVRAAEAVAFAAEVGGHYGEVPRWVDCWAGVEV